MSAKKNSDNTAAPDTEQTSTASELETLRNIIFGQAQQQLLQRISALEKSTDDKFAKLQQFIESQVANLNDTIDKTSSTLDASLHQIDKKHEDAEAELQSYADRLSSELEMSDTNSRQDSDELHSRIEKEVNLLTQKYDAKFVETLAKLEQVTQELSSTKTDRKTLAKLLATMAVNLETDD